MSEMLMRIYGPYQVKLQAILWLRASSHQKMAREPKFPYYADRFTQPGKTKLGRIKNFHLPIGIAKKKKPDSIRFNHC